MNYVITCGDEGVQINEGVRLGVVGAGVKLNGFDKVANVLKKLFGKELSMASSGENGWVKAQFDLDNWEQVDATMQQHVEALADKSKLNYAGFLPFADPRKLKHDIKGHMVRPHGVHIANKVTFTVGGGEQTYNLGCYVISAEWVSSVPEKLAKSLIQTQLDHYKELAGGRDLEVLVEKEGELGEKVADKNEATLKKLGFI